MPVSTISSTYNVGGIALSSEVSRTQECLIGQEHTLVAGSDGVQLVYTGVDDITITLAASYVAVTGTADVYWLESGVQKVKYGATLVMAGDVATLSLGAGDAYPGAGGDGTLAMTVTNQQDIDIDFDADLVEIMAASCDKLAHIEWIEAGPASIAGTKLPAEEAWHYILNSEYTNALATKTIISASVSTGDHEANGTLRIGVLHSSA